MIKDLAAKLVKQARATGTAAVTVERRSLARKSTDASYESFCGLREQLKATLGDLNNLIACDHAGVMKFRAAAERTMRNPPKPKTRFGKVAGKAPASKLSTWEIADDAGGLGLLLGRVRAASSKGALDAYAQQQGYTSIDHMQRSGKLRSAVLSVHKIG